MCLEVSCKLTSPKEHKFVSVLGWADTISEASGKPFMLKYNHYMRLGLLLEGNRTQ